MNQTYTNWEMIIIDDGSTDDTLYIIKEFKDSRIRLFSDGKNCGLSTRLNEAVLLSKGKYFARMDADDFAFPERLSRQFEFLSDNPKIDLVGSSAIVFKNQNELIGIRNVPKSHELICSKPNQGFALIHPTWMGRMKWFINNPYNEQAVLCEDQDLLLRNYGKSCYANIEEPLLGYRENGLCLKKMFKTRWSWGKRLFSFWECIKQRPGYAFGAVVKQALKAILDAVAIISGLQYMVLRHRAVPIDSKQSSTFTRIYDCIVKTRV